MIIYLCADCEKISGIDEEFYKAHIKNKHEVYRLHEALIMELVLGWAERIGNHHEDYQIKT